MTKIKIQTLRYDDENDIQFKISFSNGNLKSSLNFYGEKETFKKFAQELIDFPESKSKTASFEIGEDNPKWAYYLSLKAICIEPNGKSILRTLVDNHENLENGYRSEFSINVEIADVNRFGQLLLNWMPRDGNELIWK